MPMQMYVGQGRQGGAASSICLFVYNLPSETDENYLFQLFSPYGTVVNVKVR